MPIAGSFERELVAKALQDAEQRLARYLGEVDASAIFDQAVFLARLPDGPETPMDLLRVAVMLIEQHPESGIVSATGSGLKISALLLGAEEPR